MQFHRFYMFLNCVKFYDLNYDVFNSERILEKYRDEITEIIRIYLIVHLEKTKLSQKVEKDSKEDWTFIDDPKDTSLFWEGMLLQTPNLFNLIKRCKWKQNDLEYIYHLLILYNCYKD